MMPKLALLAGGLATRLYPLSHKIPKAMVEVAGKPFIDHQLLLLKGKGISDVVICAGHLGEQIYDYVGNGNRWGLNVQYSFDGDTLLGTGGALRKALVALGEVFFVMYGDSYLNIDFNRVWEYYRSQSRLGLMTVFKNCNNWDTSNIIYQEGEIIHYNKKKCSPDMEYIDYGLALLHREAVERIAANQYCDLADLYAELIQIRQMSGVEVKQRFYEIGTRAGLRETEDYLYQLFT